MGRVLRVISTVVCAFLMGAQLCSAQAPDSLKRAELSSLLKEYVASMETETVAVQNAEVDYILETTAPEARPFTAYELFRMYSEPHIMGLETVAVHIFDKYYATGEIDFEDPTDEFLARMFVTMNRSTLIGAAAPERSLLAPDGAEVTFPLRGRPNILFFYSTDCAKCKLESIRIKDILDSGRYPVDLVAVYLKDDLEAWKQFRHERLDITSPEVGVHHLWDPSGENDMTVDYGLVTTPRIFLTDTEGTIVGRALDSDSLKDMLEAMFYPDTARDRAYKDTVKELLYELSSDRTEDGVAAVRHLIDNYIKTRPELWTSAEDSLEVLGLANLLEGLYSRAEIGTKVPSVKADLSILRARKSGELKERDARRKLSSFKGHEVLLLFHTEGCKVCRGQIEKARELVSRNPSMRLVLVCVDDNEAVLDSFDLASLPHLILLSSKGIVVRKYFFLE